MTPNPYIVVNYRSYSPPLDIVPTVEILLRYVPAQYLTGLEYIELTNSTSTRKLRRGKTWSRGKKVRLTRCYGFYCGDHIQLLIDNLIDLSPRWIARSSMFREICFGHVLYHEIGHHIHRTLKPVRQEPEDVANRWSGHLLGLYLRQRYWYLWPVRRPIASLIRAYSRWRYPD